MCGRFSVDAVPTAIECFSTLQHMYYDAEAAVTSGNNGNSGSEVVNRYIAVGDSTGCVHLICLHQEFELSTDVGMKNKNQQYFAVSVKVSIEVAPLRSENITFLGKLFQQVRSFRLDQPNEVHR